MSGDANRREFLSRTALASMAAAGGALTLSHPERVACAAPIERDSAQRRNKLTLAAYSYRNLLKGKSPECTLEDFVRDCAEFGLDGAELTSYYFPEPVTPEYLCRLKGLAFRLGLSISSTAVGNKFCLPQGEARDRQIADVKRWVDHAAILGAPIIRIFSGKVGAGQSREDAVRLAVAAIEECCEYAGARGVFLGLENHGGLTTTVDGMLELIRAVKSPWFGAWMDTGNFHGDDVYGDLAKIAPDTLHVQVKVVTSSAGQESEPTDFGRVAGILNDVGYRGWICLEYEEGEDPRVACPRYISQIRDAFRG